MLSKELRPSSLAEGRSLFRRKPRRNVVHRKLLPRFLLAGCLLALSCPADALEHGRVKWKRPTQAEADRMASESAMTDSILQKGDIVVTDRGFFMFRGILADGITGDFVPVPNPMSNVKK